MMEKELNNFLKCHKKKNKSMHFEIFDFIKRDHLTALTAQSNE